MKHDDIVDALAYQGTLLDRMTEGQTIKEIEDDEYEREKEESHLNGQGRSAITGY